MAKGVGEAISAMSASEAAVHMGEEPKPAVVKKVKKAVDPSAPKRPPSAYLMYLSEFRKTDEFKALEGSNKDKMQHVAALWNGLTLEEKAVSGGSGGGGRRPRAAPRAARARARRRPRGAARRRGRGRRRARRRPPGAPGAAAGARARRPEHLVGRIFSNCLNGPNGPLTRPPRPAARAPRPRARRPTRSRPRRTSTCSSRARPPT